MKWSWIPPCLAVAAGTAATGITISVWRWKSGAGYEVVFEASGSPAALANRLEVARRGGSVVLVGTLPETFSLPGNLIMNRQLKVLGSFRFANVFEKALARIVHTRFGRRPNSGEYDDTGAVFSR